MSKIIILLVGFFIAWPVFSGDDSARQQCIKDCNIKKNKDLKICSKKEGVDLSRCRDRTASDVLSCSKRCDSKYPVK